MSARDCGWIAVWRAWLEAVEGGELTMEQLGIGIAVAAEANYRGTMVAPGFDGRSYPVEVGQALIGRRRFAERYRLGKWGRDRVTRALERFEALGIWSFGPAGPTPPPAPLPTPGPTPPPAPPPTLVAFKRDRGFPSRVRPHATPHATLHSSPHARVHPD